MSTFKNIAVTLAFCGIVVACMVSTVLVYNNISQAASAMANGSFTGSNFSTNNQQLMFLVRAKMV